MSIAEFIQQKVLMPRLKKSSAGSLVVYDPQGLYRELCLSLASEKVRVVDAGESSLESREAAMRILLEMGPPDSQLDGMLVYVPASPPLTDEDRQRDPFAVYAQCGEIFPQNDGDSYQDLCLRALPDHGPEIRKIFQGAKEPPAFSVIDALEGGTSWPQLRSALGAESTREILLALLNPSELQKKALGNKKDWLKEIPEFLQKTLGFKMVKPGWPALQDDLWRFVLFSEFVFDLPVPLPTPLRGVPYASENHQEVVQDLCRKLRNDTTSRPLYIEQAERIEQELHLPEQCTSIEDLGQCDTFPFEERTFLKQAIGGLTSGNTGLTRQVLERQAHSVWTGKGESAAQWELVRASLRLVEGSELLEAQLNSQATSMKSLVDFYVGQLREADHLHREFELGVGNLIDTFDLMGEVVQKARSSYRQLSEKAQRFFMRHLEDTGWPVPGRLFNPEVFDKLITPRLKEKGHRVAYLMIDALRYELGVALEKQLSEDGPVQLQAACAQFPTVTLVGMASLLPGAHSGLTIEPETKGWTVKLNGDAVSTVSQRMGVLDKRYGDRFWQMDLSEFINSKAKLAPTVDLLVLRSSEIDQQLESSPQTTLGLVPRTLGLIRSAMAKLRTLGFSEAIIVTDHGFHLNAQAEAGDVCSKPSGNWPMVAHNRMMLGDAGAPDPHNLVMPTEKLSIRGTFKQAALPRSLAPYRAGILYFHGGASLAETIVPVLVVGLASGKTQKAKKLNITLKYKNGAKRITTLRPSLQVTLEQDLFTEGQVEVLLEAQDSKGNTVGVPQAGQQVNVTVQTVTLVPGETVQVTLHMEPSFEGKFMVKVMDPITLMAHDTLSLETDYTV